MTPLSKIKPYFWYALLLIGLAALACFYGIGSYSIVDMNEGLYSEVAREMMVMKEYIIPHLNFVSYLEKPPLLYWLLIVSYKIFGVSSFAAHLIPALSSCVLIGVVFWFLQRIGRSYAAWLAAIMLTSSLGFILIGRVVFFDMLLAALLTGSLSAFYCWYTREKNFYLYAFYLLLAAAFMTKGFLPLMVAAVTIGLFLLLMRDQAQKKPIQLLNVFGIALFLLLTVPWYIAASVKLPHFGWNYIVNEQIMRFFNQRIPHDYHTGSWYFYLPRLLIYLFPWTLLLPLLFIRIKDEVNKQDPLKIFLWLWFLVTLILFSLSAAKGDYYMFLGVSPLFMLLALKLREHFAAGKYKLLVVNFGLVIVLVISGIFYVVQNELFPVVMMPQLKWVAIFLVFYSLLVLGLGFYYRQVLLGFIGTSLVIVPLLFLYINMKVATEDTYTQLTIAKYIKQHDRKRTLYLFQDYEKFSTILFYLEKRLPIIDSVSQDLYFGAKTSGAQGWFITNKDFMRQSLHKPVYVAMLKQRKDLFSQLVAPQKFCAVAKSQRIILLSNVIAECAQ